MIALMMGVAMATEPPAEQFPEVTLQDLGDEPFEVTFTATAPRTSLTGSPCVWFELDVGDRVAPEGPDDDGWRSWTHVWTDGDVPLVLQTSKGTLHLEAGDFRPHLMPSLEEVWTRKTAKMPKSALKEYFRDREVLAVVEYRIEAGRTYHARVRTESYMLPPEGPEMEPGEGHNTVLQVSDQPFVDGRPVPPLTLHERGRTY